LTLAHRLNQRFQHLWHGFAHSFDNYLTHRINRLLLLLLRTTRLSRRRTLLLLRLLILWRLIGLLLRLRLLVLRWLLLRLVTSYKVLTHDAVVLQRLSDCTTLQLLWDTRTRESGVPVHPLWRLIGLLILWLLWRNVKLLILRRSLLWISWGWSIVRLLGILDARRQLGWLLRNVRGRHLTASLEESLPAKAWMEYPRLLDHEDTYPAYWLFPMYPCC
jgi:hypothetical protein